MWCDLQNIKRAPKIMVRYNKPQSPLQCGCNMPNATNIILGAAPITKPKIVLTETPSAQIFFSSLNKFKLALLFYTICSNKTLGVIHKRRRNILGVRGVSNSDVAIGRSWVNQGQNSDMGEGGIKNGQKNSDVFYGRSSRSCASVVGEYHTLEWVHL